MHRLHLLQRDPWALWRLSDLFPSALLTPYYQSHLSHPLRQILSYLLRQCNQLIQLHLYLPPFQACPVLPCLQ